MKCTNKVRRICFCMSLILCMSLLTGCGNVAYTFPYDVNSSVSSFNVLAGTGAGRAEPFAADLCVVTEDQTGDGSVDMSQASAAVLFDVNNKKVLYSKNEHERLYPASLTKVMTALVALQNASPDTVLTATDSVKITESGAQLCGLKAGDTMTLDQALHILLMYSANDAAMLIAENIGGSVDHFVEMMNEEAQRLGATNTSFANPHGPMVQLIVGKKGKGKTKQLLDKVNSEVKDIAGSIVYLDKSTKHMYELNNKVRLIDVSRYMIENESEFLGFVCGIISQDHDLEQMYFDSFLKIAALEDKDISAVVEKLERMSDFFQVDFILSVSRDESELPESVKDKIIVSL